MVSLLPNFISLRDPTKRLKQSFYIWWQIIGIVSGCLLSITPVKAQQITGDGTLSTNVTSPDGVNFIITAGERAGGNLFHSFSQFSIPTGGSVLFNNALDVENIISRVTGGSVSYIDGLIRSNGSANLFLLNPNGIIFGPNAQLNVGSSFLASTASAVAFADGTEFSASNPSAPPLLTISVPVGLQYNATAAGIQVQGSTLAVPRDRTLALVGGDIAIVGGRLTSESGRVELGAVSGASTVELSVSDNQLQFNFPQNIPRADIVLTNGSLVDTSGSGSGDIQLVGKQITLQDSRVESTTLGTEPGGNLTVNASESVELIGNEAEGLFSTGFFADTRGSGTAANLSITTGQLTVRGEARVSAATFGAGQGGNLTVNAAESVELIGIDPPNDETLGTLFTGLLTDAEGTGAAGDLSVNTRRLIVRDGAQISAATFGEGAGGKLTVNATESVELIGASPSDLLGSGLFTAVQPTATGKAGDIEVNTRRLIVRDGAQLLAGTLGVGDGGNVLVNASEYVEAAGVSPIFLLPSGVFSAADDALVRDAGVTVGNAGNLTINTNQLIVRDGGQVAASTNGNTGEGGNLIVNAFQSVEVRGTGPEGAVGGSSALLSDATGGFSNSGTMRINTGELIVGDGGQIAVGNQGSGNAGNLEVQARSIVLDNQGTLTAATASGEGGDIKLQVQELVLMRHNSLISAEAGGTGNGGNIEIDTPLLVALENSDIVANAQNGFGGKVTIRSQTILGTQARRELTPESDITASSAAGPQFDGVVELQTPDVDPSKGLVTLPQNIVDVTNLIAQGCEAGRGVDSGKFIVTGRGGVLPYPGGTIPSEAVLEDLGTTAIQIGRQGSERAMSRHPKSSSHTPLTEAQGWVINSEGQVVLTAQALTLAPHYPGLSSIPCPTR